MVYFISNWHNKCPEGRLLCESAVNKKGDFPDLPYQSISMYNPAEIGKRAIARSGRPIHTSFDTGNSGSFDRPISKTSDKYWRPDRFQSASGMRAELQRMEQDRNPGRESMTAGTIIPSIAALPFVNLSGEDLLSKACSPRFIEVTCG